MNNPIWTTPSEKIPLQESEVHLWKRLLPQESKGEFPFEEILSDEELSHAHRFYFEKDQIQFATCRGVLRVLLGSYLNHPPEKIGFIDNKYGKPSLVKIRNKPLIHFNVSHTDGLALYGFSLSREIGVDVEKLKDYPQGDQIASRYFSEKEIQFLQSFSSKEQPDVFFTLWTLKEAYLKGIGRGFSESLKSFEVTWDRTDHQVSLINNEPSKDISQWSLKILTPLKGYRGALAVEGDELPIQFFDGSQLT